ncbi:MAG: D-Ala-D-Ala carboxypeptidase family metallohydrolase [Cypionkella sp.]|nr:D-Ala-D-Ala carboxypeptidase family metallohydrolase [Cypionkella sp.]
MVSPLVILHPWRARQRQRRGLMWASIAFAASLCGMALAGLAVVAPLPPPRPFDLAPIGDTAPGPTTAPPAEEAAPASAPQPAQNEPAARPAPNAPQPPQRPAEAPRSNPDDEDEEPTWPRRTPEQRSLDFEPREPSGEAIVNGISTDPGVSLRCLPVDLRRVLDAVVQRYGAVRVTSTYRPAWRARRNSLHRNCRAVDFRVPGQRPRSVLDFVKTLPETGGHKVYWNGLVHVDNGGWRTW